MKPRDQNPGTPRVRSIAASEAEQVFREFVQKLAGLDRPLAQLPPPRRANGHLRPDGMRRRARGSRRRP
jgi:hypothetical protein